MVLTNVLTISGNCNNQSITVLYIALLLQMHFLPDCWTFKILVTVLTKDQSLSWQWQFYLKLFFPFPTQFSIPWQRFNRDDRRNDDRRDRRRSREDSIYGSSSGAGILGAAPSGNDRSSMNSGLHVQLSVLHLYFRWLCGD
mgnify:FL=1